MHQGMLARKCLRACDVWWQPGNHLGAPETSLGAPTTILKVPVTSLEVLQISVKQSRKNNVFLGILAGTSKIVITTHCSTIVKTHVFSLYSNSCI